MDMGRCSAVHRRARLPFNSQPGEFPMKQHVRSLVCVGETRREQIVKDKVTQHEGGVTNLQVDDEYISFFLGGFTFCRYAKDVKEDPNHLW
jgi:hypothetical protein